MADLTGLNLQRSPTDLTGIRTGPVTAGGTLTPEDAALQRDAQRAIFGDTGVFSRLAARGIPLVDASGNMSPEAAYYASLAATDVASTREQQRTTNQQNQQRIDQDAQRVRIEQERARGQNAAALAMGGASLATALFGGKDASGRQLVQWLWERLATRGDVPLPPGLPSPTGTPGEPQIYPGLLTDPRTLPEGGLPSGILMGEAGPPEYSDLAPLVETGALSAEDLAALSAYLQTPLDVGTVTGLTDMDALLSFLA